MGVGVTRTLFQLTNQMVPRDVTHYTRSISLLSFIRTPHSHGSFFAWKKLANDEKLKTIKIVLIIVDFSQFICVESFIIKAMFSSF